MDTEYKMYEYTYVDKKSKEIKVVLASNVDIADLIIDIYNQHNDKVYNRKKFRFKKQVLVKVPPYVLENQQKDTAEQELRTRIDDSEKGL